MYHHLVGLRNSYNVVSKDSQKYYVDTLLIWSNEDWEKYMVFKYILENKLVEVDKKTAIEISGFDASILNDIEVIQLRSRFNPIEFFLFKYEEKLDHNVMEAIINYMDINKLLEAKVTL